MKIRKISKWIVTFLLTGILFIMTMGLIAAKFNQPSPVSNSDQIFSIKKGETLNSVTARLESAGIIRSAFLLKLICKILGTETQVKAGYYTFPPGATTIDIHNILLQGQEKQVKITFPEGWSLKKVAGHLEEYNIALRQDFLTTACDRQLLDEFQIAGDSFEGFLFPDTYYLSEEMPAEEVIRKMATNFFKNLAEVVPDLASYTPSKVFERVIMASIVEREYRVADEAVLIASVFYNRLKYRVGLESCATLEYIITDIQGKPHPEYISLEDKEIASPYNTYKWNGLPPGPISNPGKVSLHAAFFPAKTDYWFFLLKDPAVGRHYFSEDLEEHNQAKLYYLKGYGNAP